MKSVKDGEAANPFGGLPYSFNLIKALCKAQKTANLLFTHYVNCRANVKREDGSPWQFVRADIETHCGLHYAFTKGMCAAFVKAGLFTCAGLTTRGSLAFNLNREKFEAYLKGSTALEPITDKQELNQVLGEYNVPELPTESFEEEQDPLNHYGGGPVTITGVDPKTPVTATGEKRRVLKRENVKGEDSALPVSHTHASGTQVCQDTRAQSQSLPSAATGAVLAADDGSDRLARANLVFNPFAAPVYKSYDSSEVVKAAREAQAKEITRREFARWQELCAKSVSPLKAKEALSDLPVAEKLQVFKAGAKALVSMGSFGRPREPVNYADIVPEQHVRYHFDMTSERGWNMLQEYLSSDPSTTVEELLQLLDTCCWRAATEKKKDEGYRENNQEVFAGENLTSFVQYLNQEA
jgi:hypothetical protein